METTVTTAEMPMPDLAGINRASLWLATLRRIHDSGVPLAEARRLADQQLGFGATTT